jgi:hypothetical protein
VESGFGQSADMIHIGEFWFTISVDLGMSVWCTSR